MSDAVPVPIHILPARTTTTPLRAASSSKLAEDSAPSSRLRLGLVAVEDGEQRLPDLAGLLAGVDARPDARVLVVTHDGGRLFVVGGQALLEGRGVVVAALDQRLARLVVRHGLLGRVEGRVVAAPAGRVHEAACDARHEEGVVDLQLDGVLEGLVARLEHGVEGFGLGDSAGEAVEDEAVGYGGG